MYHRIAEKKHPISKQILNLKIRCIRKLYVIQSCYTYNFSSQPVQLLLQMVDCGWWGSLLDKKDDQLYLLNWIRAFQPPVNQLCRLAANF